jgi:lipid II:glycine glycyltransferase (peptidoglycan interpeptide bridge formation enzyme)
MDRNTALTLCKIDNSSKIEPILKDFEDYSIYHTSAYGEVSWGKEAIDRQVLMQGTEILSYALVRKVVMPICPFKIAYIGWGPVWKRKNQTPDLSILDEMLSRLIKTYTENGYILRVFPNIFDTSPEAPLVFTLLQSKGFTRLNLYRRTILLDLSPSVDELHKGFRKKWRQTLNHAERNNLTIHHDTSTDSIQSVVRMYSEMHARKKFAAFVDVEKYIVINGLLDNACKLETIRCSNGEQDVSGIVWAKMGAVGLPLIAATTAKALELNAAYLMWWYMIQAMKADNLSKCDLGGIDKKDNPGGYIFKSGIGATHGVETAYIGNFLLAKSFFLLVLMKAAETTRGFFFRMKIALSGKPKKATRKES